MNAPAPEMTTAPTTFTCGKCDGRGRLNWASHYANGVCFACKGTGNLDNRDVTNAQWYQMQISNLERLAEAALWGYHNGREDYAAHYIGAMIPGLFKVGTDGAREVLRFVRAGEYYESATNTRYKVESAIAARIAARIIELGRAAKAAD